jgi:beta-glucosidase/6-phospho-beta-glucosidase/beta-galactosidase
LQWPGLGDPNPDGLSLMLRELAGYGKPIYITENGLIDTGDDMQTRYLVSHLAAVERALREGVPVKGYFWWTLVDNFEWAEGYHLRFGLYHLDLLTQQRTPRPVADAYARIIRDNAIAADLRAGYAL